LTRHIRETFRSFPVSDLAKMVLEARERYRIRFTATEPVRLNQCLADGSLWLSREEAISHLLSGPALEHYYTAEDIQVDPPAGNFAVIAVCGMSGVVLGPPNHHEYQRNIARLHRERFSDMPLERFKSRIRMESGEEILEKWREQVSRVRQYRIKPDDQPSPVEETPVAETPVEEVLTEEATTEEATTEEATTEEATTEEKVADEIAEEAPEAEAAPEATAPEATELEEPEEAQAPAPAAKAEEGPIFKSFEEVARHFREHFAPLAIVETAVAVVPGNIAGRLLSPGLLAHLRQETEKLRRGFPLGMIQSLCGEFERKGLKFFKRGKKSLHVSAVRPKALDEATNLTDAIQAIVEFVKTAPKPNVASLLEALVPGFKRPEGPAIEESAEWSEPARAVLKDLRWLTAEGYLLEFADTGLAIGRVPQENAPAQSKPAQEKPAKPKKAPKVAEETVAEETVAEETVAEETVAEETVSEESVSEESVSEESVSEESVSEETVSEESVSEESVSEESVSEETVSEESVSEESVSEESVSEDATESTADLAADPEDLGERPADPPHEDESDPDDSSERPDSVAPVPTL
jgi:hypothetical protein